MNYFHLPVQSDVAWSSESAFHHVNDRNRKVFSGDLIKKCITQITPDSPERGIVAAKVMQCALREIIKKDRVKTSLAEYYGINYLLTSLTQAIEAFESDGRVDELMFITMRIGRELSSCKEKVNPQLMSQLM